MSGFLNSSVYMDRLFAAFRRAHNYNYSTMTQLRGGSICNENPFITPSINALGFYVICQTKYQSVAVML